MKSVLLGFLILPSTLTTTGQIEVRWISFISFCCTSRLVDGDEITRGRPGVKYLWLIYVRQRTKWISRKLRFLDCSSSPFVIALKSSITNKMHTKFWFCNKHNSLSVVQCRTFTGLLKNCYFFLGKLGYGCGTEVMARCLFTRYINVLDIFMDSTYSFYVTSQRL